jgi:S-adenosylmethionine hydrolase
MARPVLALLTDFGLRDHYVAAMKGVALGICPDAALVDITHEVPPQDILSGALELDAVVGYLPRGTVVIAVVDPGVGSARRGVAIDAGELRFVGPDNGLFSLALRRTPPQRIVEITNDAYTLPSVSRTFEGRDRFAPAAAWLASGVNLAELGPPVDALIALDVPEPVSSADGLDGEVLGADRFGNLITNIPEALLGSQPGRVSIHVSGTVIDGVVHTYGVAPSGALCALVGSTNRLEIAVNGGSAAARLGVGRGAAVQVRARVGA